MSLFENGPSKLVPPKFLPISGLARTQYFKSGDNYHKANSDSGDVSADMSDQSSGEFYDKVSSNSSWSSAGIAGTQWSCPVGCVYVILVKSKNSNFGM